MIKRSITIDFLIKDCNNRNFLVDEGFLELGKIPSRNFIPDFSKLVKRLDEIFVLGDLIKDMDDSQHRILIAALYYSSRLAKFDLHFAQPVYFNISSPRVDFVDCWYKGYAVGANRKKYSNHRGEKSWDYTIVVLSNLKDDYEVTLHLPPSSIMTKEKFMEHKKRLIEEGRYRAPKMNLGMLRQEWKDVSDEEKDANKISEKEIDIETDDYDLAGVERNLMSKFGKKKKKKRRGVTKVGDMTKITIIDQSKKTRKKKKKKRKGKRQ